MLLVAAGCGRLGFGSAALDPDATDVDAGDRDAASDGLDATDANACASMFCDGFEDPSFSAWSGVAVQTGSSADRDASFGFIGASLHVISPVGTSLAARYADVFPPVPPTNQWVRLYIYAASGMELDAEPIELTNAAIDYQIVFALYDSDTDIHAHNLAGGFSVLSGSAPPRDTWVCYELHVNIGANGAVELYRDGALLVAQPGIDTRPPVGGLPRLRVGIPSKPTSLSENIFVDEVAAGTTRIGCL